MKSLRVLFQAVAVVSITACASSGGANNSTVAPTPDPRVGLRPGRWDAAQAAWNMRLLSTTPPRGRTLGATHSDLAFSGNLVIQGNYNGFDIYDISNPARPRHLADVRLPG